MTILEFADKHFDGLFVLAVLFMLIVLGGFMLRYLDGPHMIDEVDDGE